MRAGFRASLLACTLALGGVSAGPASAQKQGGTLHLYHRDSPASASIHEETTVSAIAPFMSIYNNLVMYKQDEPKNSLDTIVPDLATRWAWNEDRTALTFTLREGVKWHDGKPFTARDVKCTWDMLAGRSEVKLRVNPRATWYANLDSVSVEGDYQATFHLKRPQPALLTLLAAGHSPVYPCHVSARDMRTKPIGTGPFKFVEYKQNESIKLARNPDYWKPGRPYLDAVEWTIITNRSTAMLAFIAGKVDMTFPGEVTVPLMRDVGSQAPQAICKLVPNNVSVNLIVNREAPPFDNADIRRAMALAMDRKSFIDILSEGEIRHRRGHAAAARRQLGDAARHAEQIAGLWQRRREEPGRGARADGKGRLWAAEAAGDQGLDAQHRALPRPGRDPDRPAQADLQSMASSKWSRPQPGIPRSCARITRSGST